MAIIDDFKNRFNKFSEPFVDEELPFFIGVYPCYYGGDYSNECDKEIILNMLAHMLYVSGGYGGVIDGDKAVGQVIASKSVGSVSTSYAVPDISTQSLRNNFFSTSGYGRRYLILTMNNFGGRFV